MLDSALEKFIEKHPESPIAQASLNSLDYKIADLIFEEIEKHNQSELFRKLISGAIGVVVSSNIPDENKIGILETSKSWIDEGIGWVREGKVD